MLTNRTSLIVSIAALLSIAGISFAQGVGNLGSLPTQFETQVPANTFNVVDAAGMPIPVQRDPNGPAWVKNFTGPGGGPFVAFGQQPIQVTEILIVAPNLPWSDWHEQILTPGWGWSNNAVLLANNVPAAGLTINNTPGSTMNGGILDFYFNSLAPGTLVEIRKELVWLAQPGQMFQGTVQIAQYPTPEPASIGLLAVGGILAMRRRNRAVA